MDRDETPAGIKLVATVVLLMAIDWYCWLAEEPVPAVETKGKPR